MNHAIETYGLSKNYNGLHVVKDVNLTVKRGEIYAFLGLNGAGKTTTIRALLGMIRPSEGNVKLLGQPIGPNGSGPWSQVGHLVESPSAYPDLSVRENLEIARRMHGIQQAGRVNEIMQYLSIASYADQKAGTLSMGNLQRLGLARALLHNPELVILDEPSNALDPAGIVEIRELLKSLARMDGKTIFLSSHILTEVHLLADRIGIIHKGRLIKELEAKELEGLFRRQLIVRAKDLQKATHALSNFKVEKLTDAIAIQDEFAIKEPDQIASILVKAGTPPTHLAIQQENLEDYFLRLTSQGVSQ
jgi:ABC-2 type transport system ATP-binding protein